MVTGPASKGGEGRNAAGEASPAVGVDARDAGEASPAANLQKREGKGRIHHGSERERERRAYLSPNCSPCELELQNIKEIGGRDTC